MVKRKSIEGETSTTDTDTAASDRAERGPLRNRSNHHGFPSHSTGTDTSMGTTEKSTVTAAPTTSSDLVVIPVVSTVHHTTTGVSPLDKIDVVQRIVSFIGPQQYRFVASINRTFRDTYQQAFPQDTTVTRLNVSTIDSALFCLSDIRNSIRIPHQHRETLQVALCRSAAARGDLNILYHLRAVYCSWDETTCSTAALHGHKVVVAWAFENGCDWQGGGTTCANAALHGHLPILKYALLNYADWGYDTPANAALNGHLRVLKWLRRQLCDWNEDVCANAARNGHFELLKWARKNGCPWDNRVTENAALIGHLPILKYALRLPGINWLYYDETMKPCATMPRSMDIYMFCSGPLNEE